MPSVGGQSGDAGVHETFVHCAATRGSLENRRAVGCVSARHGARVTPATHAALRFARLCLTRTRSLACDDVPNPKLVFRPLRITAKHNDNSILRLEPDAAAPGARVGLVPYLGALGG